MATMLETLMLYRRNNPGTWSALEIEHFVLASVKTAIADTINAVHNGTVYSISELTSIVDPNQLVEEFKHDFTAHVQQYWPASAIPDRETPDVIPAVKFSDAMAQRRRELMQPAAAPLGHPVVVSTTDVDNNGEHIEKLVHLTTEEMEAANFKSFDPEAYKRELDADANRLNEAQTLALDDAEQEALDRMRDGESE